MGVAVRTEGETVEFGVRVSPGARHSSLIGAYGERLKVAIDAPPQRGKANRALERLLATLLGVRQQDVEVVKGLTSRDKTVRVSGAPASALQERLAALVHANQRHLADGLAGGPTGDLRRSITPHATSGRPAVVAGRGTGGHRSGRHG